ncbi:glycosyltransferase family 39 protein [Dehalococcoidia bacterium]|nr:glycosyltransferase family 39 protein [Dehalococcoidia bacterium]
MSYVMVLVLALVWMCAAIAAGHTLLSLFRVTLSGTHESLMMSLMLGFALVGFMVFGLGSAGLLSATMAWSVFGALLLLGIPTWRTVGLRNPIATVWPVGMHPSDGARGRWVTASLLAVIGFTAGLNLIAALAPPTAWDALQYHLAAPAFFIRDGGISFVPVRNWASPFTAEMWSVIGLLVSSDRLPVVFQWAMGVGSAAALYLLAASRTSRQTALLASAIFYTSPHVILLASSAKSDLAWMTFLFLSLHALLAWRERKETGWLVLSALATGLVVATKFQGLYWAPGMLLVLAGLHGKTWRGETMLASARVTAYASIVSLVASPYLIRNWIAGGDPLWPYGYQIFKSSHWSQSLSEKYSSWTQGPGDSLWHLIALPWNITLNQAAWPFGLQIPLTPLVLAFVPALVLMWRQIPPDRRWFFLVAAVPAAVHYIGWFSTYQQPRYIFPILGILMIPAAYAFWQLINNSLARWPARGLLVASLAAFLTYGVAFNLQFVPVIAGAESDDEFLASKVSFYDDISWTNGNLPAEARILVFHDKTFYFQRDLIQGALNTLPAGTDTTADEYLELLTDDGITHVFLPSNVRDDIEYSTRMALLAELEGRGFIRTVYSNPHAVLMKSRTLSRSETVSLEVLELNRQAQQATSG